MVCITTVTLLLMETFAPRTAASVPKSCLIWYGPGRTNPRLAQFVKSVDFLPEEVFMRICSRGLLSGSPNPDTILDQ